MNNALQEYSHTHALTEKMARHLIIYSEGQGNGAPSTFLEVQRNE